MLEVGNIAPEFSEETFGELCKGKIILGDTLC
jgi:hypothetical protein